MPHPVNCPCCDGPIEGPLMDWACALPDEVFAIATRSHDEFQRRVRPAPDLCVLLDESPDPSPEDARFFLRGLLHVPVEGSRQPFTYGVWYEIAREDGKRVSLAWNNPEAYVALRVKGKLANQLVGVGTPTVGIEFVLASSDPESRLGATASDSPQISALMTRGWSKAEFADVSRILRRAAGLEG